MPQPTTHLGREPFGRLADGRAVTRYCLRATDGMQVEVLDYGAVLQGIHVADRAGRVADVTLGYDDVEGYERGTFYLGAAIGRNAGRIARATFALDGRRYQLAANNGTAHLHGGKRGFDRALWRAEPFTRDGAVGVTLAHHSPDGDEGYPGAVDIRVTYTLAGDGVLAVDWEVTADAATPVNPTQHAYFNLAGEGTGDVLGHELALDADAYTPLAPDLIPTGEVAPVEGTPLDFRVPRRVGDRIDADHPQLAIAGGYDHNVVVRRAVPGLARAARLVEPVSGRALEVWTTEPGMQLYSGNFLDGSPGKHGHRYERRSGICFETQHFPDAPNQPAFPSTVLRPGEVRRSRTEFRFSIAR